MSKKIFLLIILLILVSCSSYRTGSLLQTYTYDYKISYPRTWTMFIGSTDASMYQIDEVDGGGSLNTIAFINKMENKEISVFSVPKNKYEKHIIQKITARIEIFLLDENGKLYKNWINDLKSEKVNFVYMIEDFSNPNNVKLNIPYKIFNKLYVENSNNDKRSLIELFVNIGDGKIIVFTFNNEDIEGDKNKVEKEIYKIINSLRRYKRVNE